jgi:hypothetical protein
MRLRFLLPALALATVAGCDSILDTDPVDRIPIENAITDAPTARAALIGAYDALTALSYYGRNFLVLGDLPADNADHQGTLQALGAVDRNQITVDNGTIEGVWGAIYTAIGRVNLIIQKVPDVPGLDAEERDQILGEAYFLRALHYHNLVKFWGDVPMPLEPVTSPDQAAGFVRVPVAQVYTQILADLAQADELITDEDQRLQASAAAVDALRSRVLLYMSSTPGLTQNWQGVIDAANEVEAAGIELVDDYPELFTDEGTPTSEDIFRLGFTAAEFNEMGWYYLFDGRTEVTPTEDLYLAYEANDERFAWSVAEDDGDFEGTKYPTTVGAEDVHVIRLAEVILNKAEAYARLNLLQQAVDEYNRVRVRAGLTPHVLGTHVTTQQDVLDAIWQERRVELAMEGDRWPDLVRTGRESLVLAPDRLFQKLFPIPQSERVVAPGLTQNPGYPQGV